MTLIIKQSTAYKLPVVLIDDTDFKSPETTVAYNAAGMTVKYCKEASDGDHTWSTFSIATGDWEELGNGVYLIKFSTSHLDTVGKFLYFCVATGILPYYGEAYIIQEDTFDGRLNDIHDTLDLVKTETDTHPTLAEINASEVLAKEATFTHATYGLDKIKAETATIKTETESHPTLAEIEASAVLALEASLTAIKGAGFDTLTDSLIKIHDDHVTHLSAAPSTHAAADIWSVGTRAITDKAGFSLSDAGIDGILDEVIETLTLRQIQRILLSALAGKSTGGGGATLTFKDYADAKARITATVDSDGNRTAITLDGT